MSSGESDAVKMWSFSCVNCHKQNWGYKNFHPTYCKYCKVEYSPSLIGKTLGSKPGQ